MAHIRISSAEAARIVRRRGWLSEQPPEFQDEVCRRAVLKSYRPGEYLYRIGDPAGGIYGLVEGNVVVAAAPWDATSRLVYWGLSGHWIGEGGFITREPRRVEVQARLDTVMMHLPLEEMDRMAFADPGVMRNFIRILINTMVAMTRIINDLQLLDPARRIAATIDRANVRDGEEVPLTQSELGEMARASRRQVSIAMKQFSELGLATTSYGRIVIRDAAGLLSLIHI